jgi:hypothetical protein
MAVVESTAEFTFVHWNTTRGKFRIRYIDNFLAGAVGLFKQLSHYPFSESNGDSGLLKIREVGL